MGRRRMRRWSGTAVDPELGRCAWAGENIYYVSRIVDCRRTRKGELKFLVKWKFCPPRYNTWEPLASFDDFPCVLQEYFEHAAPKSKKLRYRKFYQEHLSAAKPKLPRVYQIPKTLPPKPIIRLIRLNLKDHLVANNNSGNGNSIASTSVINNSNDLERSASDRNTHVEEFIDGDLDEALDKVNDSGIVADASLDDECNEVLDKLSSDSGIVTVTVDASLDRELDEALENLVDSGIVTDGSLDDGLDEALDAHLRNSGIDADPDLDSDEEVINFINKCGIVAGDNFDDEQENFIVPAEPDSLFIDSINSPDQRFPIQYELAFGKDEDKVQPKSQAKTTKAGMVLRRCVRYV